MPVIAYGVGGATESVLDGLTGVLFGEQDAASLAEAIERFEQLELDAGELRSNAAQFGRERFHEEMAAAIYAAWRARSRPEEPSADSSRTGA